MQYDTLKILQFIPFVLQMTIWRADMEDKFQMHRMKYSNVAFD